MGRPPKEDRVPLMPGEAVERLRDGREVEVMEIAEELATSRVAELAEDRDGEGVAACSSAIGGSTRATQRTLDRPARRAALPRATAASASRAVLSSVAPAVLTTSEP
jgi:hypothetical protein